MLFGIAESFKVEQSKVVFDDNLHGNDGEAGGANEVVTKIT